MSDILLSRITGGLFGVAIGDALGVTTEFMTKEEIKQKYGKLTGIIGGGWLSVLPGEWSDDTDMTLAVAKGIVKNYDHPIEAIGGYFMKWYDSDPKDIGNIIRRTIENFEGNWYAAAEKTHEEFFEKTAGNGSLMRTLPVALAYDNEVSMIYNTIKQSKMTHFDDETANICVLYNKIAMYLLQGEQMYDAIKKVVTDTNYEYILHEKPECSPSGYVVDTFRWVMYWLLSQDTFEEVVVSAVNNGGDADTIAAICGGLKGIEVGYYDIPAHLRNKLIHKHELKVIAENVYNARLKNKEETYSIKIE